jgi:predicted glycosyltransferase
MSRGVRIVLYAVNGSGLGHLTRLVAVARWIRRYALFAGARAEIYFLTSSEAESLLFHERFASFKLPSKTIVSDAGIDKLTYLGLAKQWVWHSIGLLRPDLFVVDTFPRGAFGELLSALDLCRKKAFIYRPVNDEFAQRADFQAMLPLYDLLLVPEDEGSGKAVLPAGARSKTRHTGPIMARERVELLSREVARKRLGIGNDQLAVWISAGGGGDARAEEQIRRTCETLSARLPGAALVVAAGPLYRGARLHGEGIRWLNEPGASELVGAIDFAVCAAGYNTYHELMHAGVPAIFWPQRKVADEQAERAKRAAACGAAYLIDHEGCAEALARAALRLADPDERARAAQAARALVPKNFARSAAAELLRLVWAPAEVEAAEEAMSDDLLAAARDLALPVDPFVEVMHALAPRAAEGAEPDVGAARALAVEILRAATGQGAPPEAAVLLAQGLSRRLPRTALDERAAAVMRLVAALAPFGDWTAAVTFIKLLRPERRLDAAALGDELAAFLSALGEHGRDLYAGVALLSAAQGLGSDAPGNGESLREARARLGRNSDDPFAGGARP